jgi:hypothetical protein
MGRALTTSALLEAWERGRTARPLLRALDLLARVYPDATPEQMKALPIGQRDARLMEIREALFGPSLTCLAACPRCGERLEITLEISQLRSQPAAEDGAQVYALAAGGCEVQFRLPNSQDMAVLADLPDAGQARRALLERCVQQAARDGVPVNAADLPEELVGRIAGRMAQIDPLADIQIALTCPSCAQQWSTAFDIVSYLWSEINTWAMRVLREVHRLASAYGWSEAEILALSPARRQMYLELIG